MMIIDLPYIQSAALQDKERFRRLALHIKTIPVSVFDELAAPVVKDITASIDCTACGNCCRVQEPGVSEEEMERLAEIKKMPLPDFKDRYIAWDTNGVSFICRQPCTFLTGNECSIYAHRPGSCADFPGLERPRLKWRWKQVEENYGICPIVFNTVQKLYEICGVGPGVHNPGENA